MGREIRRAPAGWEHPKYEAHEVQYEWQRGAHRPVHDEAFADAMQEWWHGWQSWKAGVRPEYCPADFEGEYWDWDSGPPDPKYYRPAWTEAEATHLAVYENVSEGTPVTPFFATPEELIDYLVANGDFWDQERGEGGWQRQHAEAFVKRGWAPSLVVTFDGKGGSTPQTPRDGA